MVTTTRCRQQQISLCHQPFSVSQISEWLSGPSTSKYVSYNSSRSTSKATGCKKFMWGQGHWPSSADKDACTWGRKDEYEAGNTRPVSPRCHHSDVPVLPLCGHWPLILLPSRAIGPNRWIHALQGSADLWCTEQPFKEGFFSFLFSQQFTRSRWAWADWV